MTVFGGVLSDNYDYFSMIITTNNCVSFPSALMVSPSFDGGGWCSSENLTLIETNQESIPACDGTTITNVAFYQNNILLGMSHPSSSNTYTFIWTNPPPGYYNLTAQATDSTGVVAPSVPVSLLVCPFPQVSITSPSSGSGLCYLSNITITASASEIPGPSCTNSATITDVAYYTNGVFLGSSSSSPYSYTWSSPPKGDYTLIALVTDSGDSVGESAPVTISVGASFPAIGFTSPSPNGENNYCDVSSITLDTTNYEAPGNCSTVSITNVAFYTNGVLLYSSASSSHTWSSPPSGYYILTAVAKDSLGSEAESAPVIVTVGSFPVVTVINTFNGTVPAYGEELWCPSTITLTAYAIESNNPSCTSDTVSTVYFEIYKGTNFVEQLYTSSSSASLYSVTWDAPAPGDYNVVAYGKDNTGLEGPTSEELDITVEGSAFTGSMNAARELHTATLLNNGEVLAAGGNTGTGYLSSAELWNQVTGSWTLTNSMSVAREYHTATLMNNGNVLVAAGKDDETVYSSAEYFNPANGTWTGTGALHYARWGQCATLLTNGLVLVEGGFIGSGPLTSAELYYPATGVWSNTGSLNYARYLHTATLLPNGQVLVAGGGGTSGNSVLEAAELYNPATGAWTTTGSLNQGRSSHTATLLPNGQVLAAGGQYDGGPISSAELYNPATGKWALTGSLKATRYGHTASMLSQNAVLAAGGFGSLGVLAGVELYDPNSGTWSTNACGNLNTARYVQTATMLPNGQVLIAGGFGATNHLSSAELYSP
jgi:hypothetical protein